MTRSQLAVRIDKILTDLCGTNPGDSTAKGARLALDLKGLVHDVRKGPIEEEGELTGAEIRHLGKTLDRIKAETPDEKAQLQKAREWLAYWKAVAANRSGPVPAADPDQQEHGDDPPRGGCPEEHTPDRPD